MFFIPIQVGIQDLSHLVIIYSCFSIMGLPVVGLNAGPVKALKAARVLRPLKLVSNVPSKIKYF